MRVEEIRKQFPALDEKVYGRPLVYFDNAATSQRPQSVIDKWDDMSVHGNANIHRAMHYLSSVATAEYESARECVRKLINADSVQEIVFASGATAAINTVAFSFGEAFVGEGDEIVVAESEHHSDIVPWQMMCMRKKALLKVLHVDDDGRLKTEELDSLLTEKTKLLAVAHISNVLGIVNPVREIVARCHEKGVAVLVDGAQGVVHKTVDVKELDCDFYVFSGHKIYAAPGTGVLYGKRELMEAMPPYSGGGEMVGTVSFSGTSYAPLPLKFEAGTPNFTGTATLVPAIGCLEAMRDGEIAAEQEKIKEYLYDNLQKNNKLHLYGKPRDFEDKIPLFSFSIDGVHHEDLAQILDKMGIAVRSGQMCAEPLMDRFGVTGMLRASLAPYNTMQEAEYFIESLDRAVKMLS